MPPLVLCPITLMAVLCISEGTSVKKDGVWGPERAAPDALGHGGFFAQNERLIAFQMCPKFNRGLGFKSEMTYLCLWDLGCVSSFSFSGVQDCMWRVASRRSYILMVSGMVSQPGGYFLSFLFFSETGLRRMGRAGIDEAPSKSPEEYLEPPLIQQHPFSCKGLDAWKGGCAFCDCW